MLNAFKDFGIAFPQPLPAVTLDSGFQLTLRGTHRLDMIVSYLGCRNFETRELLHIQRFHRAVLCWESDFSTEKSKPQSTAMSPKEWSESSNGACYFIFPLCEEHSMIDPAPKNPDTPFTPPRHWDRILETCADEAHSLIRKNNSCNIDFVAYMSLRENDRPKASLSR